MKHIYKFKFDDAEYTAKIQILYTGREWRFDPEDIFYDGYEWCASTILEYDIANKNGYQITAGSFNMERWRMEEPAQSADDALEDELKERIKDGSIGDKLGIHWESEIQKFREKIKEAYNNLKTQL